MLQMKNMLQRAKTITKSANTPQIQKLCKVKNTQTDKSKSTMKVFQASSVKFSTQERADYSVLICFWHF